MVDILSLLTNKWGWSHVKTCQAWNIPINWEYIKQCLEYNEARTCGRCRRLSGYYNPDRITYQCYRCGSLRFTDDCQMPGKDGWYTLRKPKRRKAEFDRYTEMKIRRKAVDKLLGYT